MYRYDVRVKQIEVGKLTEQSNKAWVVEEYVLCYCPDCGKSAHWQSGQGWLPTLKEAQEIARRLKRDDEISVVFMREE